MLSKTSKLTAGLMLFAAVAFGVGGCTPMETTTSSGSRHVLYNSVEELADDSAVIVVGSASGRMEPDDGDVSLTGTRIVVVEVVGTEKPGLTVGDEIVVLQLGTDSAPGPAPLIKEGKDYLLFLTNSALPGDRATSYFVTGGTAGLWLPTSAEQEFTRSGDEGDKLPTLIKLADLRSK